MEESTSSSMVDALAQEKLKQLRTLVHAIALAVLVLTGTLFVFFYLQVVTVKRNTTELVNYITEYERSNASEFIATVHRKFADFRKDHPDFAPVYSRYFGTNEPPPLSATTNAANPSKVAPLPLQ